MPVVAGCPSKRPIGYNGVDYIIHNLAVDGLITPNTNELLKQGGIEGT
jgi:hypothetical protein